MGGCSIILETAVGRTGWICWNAIGRLGFRDRLPNVDERHSLCAAHDKHPQKETVLAFMLKAREIEPRCLFWNPTGVRRSRDFVSFPGTRRNNLGL